MALATVTQVFVVHNRSAHVQRCRHAFSRHVCGHPSTYGRSYVGAHGTVTIASVEADRGAWASAWTRSWSISTLMNLGVHGQWHSVSLVGHRPARDPPADDWHTSYSCPMGNVRTNLGISTPFCFRARSPHVTRRRKNGRTHGRTDGRARHAYAVYYRGRGPHNKQ